MNPRRSLLVVIIILGLSLPLPAAALTKNITDASGSYTVEDPLTYPIIFIPGVGGSNLDDTNGNNIWPGHLVTLPSTFDALKLDSNGKGQKLVPNGTVRYGLGDDYGIAGEWFAFPVYQGFYDYMAKEGYTMEPNLTTGKRFFDFPYDFRMDTQSHIKDLDKKIDQVLGLTKSKRVILYAHSMGGYLARLYMKDAGRAEKVAGVVFMGTPHHGAAMPFWALTEGYNFGNSKLSNEKMWEVSGNWPGGYQLLADFPIFQDPSGKFLSPGEAYANPNWISTREYQKFIQLDASNIDYDPVPGIPNKKMAADALSFHANVLGDSVTAYPWVHYTMIKGVSQPTTQYFEATYTSVPGFELPLLNLKQIKTAKGDATVPSPGAKIEGVHETIEVPAEHGNIPSDAKAQENLTRISKSINKEVERTARAEKLKTRVNNELAVVRSWNLTQASESENESLPGAIFRLIFMGQPDKDKIRLRDEIRKQIKNLFANGQINLKIGAAGTETEDAYYMSINEQSVITAGHGNTLKSAYTITIPDPKDFEAFLNGTLSPRAAYEQQKFTVTGSGLLGSLKTKALQWAAKYGKKFTN